MLALDELYNQVNKMLPVSRLKTQPMAGIAIVREAPYYAPSSSPKWWMQTSPRQMMQAGKLRCKMSSST